MCIIIGDRPSRTISFNEDQNEHFGQDIKIWCSNQEQETIWRLRSQPRGWIWNNVIRLGIKIKLKTRFQTKVDLWLALEDQGFGFQLCIWPNQSSLHIWKGYE